jgi:hypothetical protein
MNYESALWRLRIDLIALRCDHKAFFGIFSRLQVIAGFNGNAQGTLR